jgi:hypothetical protein
MGILPCRRKNLCVQNGHPSIDPDQISDAVYKPGSGLNGSDGFLVRDNRIRPKLVVTNCFQVVGSW